MKKDIVKTLISIMVGAAACYGIRQEIGGFMHLFVHTMYWESSVSVWTELAIFLVPGILVGLIMPYHSMRNAVLAMLIGVNLINIDISLHLKDFKYFNAHYVAFMLTACVCGAIASCYGARLSGHVPRFFKGIKLFLTAD